MNTNNLNQNKTILVTGAFGFIGLNTIELLISQNFNIIAIDLPTTDTSSIFYYRKQKLINLQKIYNSIHIIQADLNNYNYISNILKNFNFHHIIHLAALPNISFSINNPLLTLNNNSNSMLSILEISKQFNVPLIYASSSSVYGNSLNKTQSENDCLQTLNPYALSKKYNEEVAQIYKHHYNVQSLGLRFFTVFGPYNRPDMFVFKTINSILNNKTINLFNNGSIFRDFTFVKDISLQLLFFINNFQSIIDKKISILNCGPSNPHSVLYITNTLSSILNKKTNINLINSKPDFDSSGTHSNNSLFNSVLPDFKFTHIDLALNDSVKWQLDYLKSI